MMGDFLFFSLGNFFFPIEMPQLKGIGIERRRKNVLSSFFLVSTADG
jgi:hypothetical protein